MLIDKLAATPAIECKSPRMPVAGGRGEIEGRAVKLVKPQTYMNLSGEAVACLVTKHKLAEPGENLIVISDDLALPFGKIRIRARGSAGGHNGLKSIIARWARTSSRGCESAFSRSIRSPIRRDLCSIVFRAQHERKWKRFWKKRRSAARHPEGWRFESNDGIQQ